MSAFQQKYIAQDAGLSYKAFLDHFQNQAKGPQNTAVLPNNTGGLKSKLTTPLCHDGFILVDMSDKNIKNELGETLPRLEVVDPNELIRRRALDELSQQQQDKNIAADGTKSTKIRKRPHSSSNGRKTRISTSSKKKRAEVKKLVNRVKDLFDE